MPENKTIIKDMDWSDLQPHEKAVRAIQNGCISATFEVTIDGGGERAKELLENAIIDFELFYEVYFEESERRRINTGEQTGVHIRIAFKYDKESTALESHEGWI